MIRLIKCTSINGSSWNTGISTSPETSPTGISEKANGDLVMVGLSDRIRTYKEGHWDAGLKIPSSEGSPSGIEVAANGNFWLAGNSTEKVYTGTYTNPTHPLRKGPCYWTGAQWQLFEKPTISLTQTEFDAIAYKDPGIVYPRFLMTASLIALPAIPFGLADQLVELSQPCDDPHFVNNARGIYNPDVAHYLLDKMLALC